MSEKITVLYVGESDNNLLYQKWADFFYNNGFNVILLGERKPHKKLPFKTFTFLNSRKEFVKKFILSLFDFVAWSKSFEYLKSLSFSKNSMKHFLYTIYAFSFVPEIQKILKEEKVDIIHLHYGFQPLCLAFLKVKTNLPIIYSTWGSDIFKEPFRSKIRNLQIRSLMKKARIIHTESEYQKKHLIEKLKIDGRKIIVKSWGIEIDKLDKIRHDYNSLKWRHKFKIPEGAKVFISLRKLEKRYRINCIIEAFNVIKDENTFLIIGSFGSEFKNLRSLVKKLGLEKRVFFTGKLESEKEICELIIDADFYIQYPESDGVSQTLLMAMGLKRLCLSSAVGDNKLLLNDEFLVSNFSDLILKMKNLLNISRKRYYLLVEENYKMIKKYHSKKNFLDFWMQVYKDVRKIKK